MKPKMDSLQSGILILSFYFYFGEGILIFFSAYCFIHRYVPNELRGGMISLSLAPANAAVLLFLMQVMCLYNHFLLNFRFSPGIKFFGCC